MMEKPKQIISDPKYHDINGNPKIEEIKLILAPSFHT